MITIYKDWVWTKGQAINAQQYVVEIHNPSGKCWYGLSEELDALKDRSVVGVDNEGRLAWATNGVTYGQYVPQEYHTVLIFEPSIDVDSLKGKVFDGKEFIEPPTVEPVERTKADIMADLVKLQEELKAMA